MIYYFGIQMHSNLGDLARYICIRKWIEREYSEYQIIEVDSKVFMNSSSNLIKN